MNSPVDYEYEAMQKREQQEAAIRAEEKKEWKRLGLRFVLHMLLYAVTICCLWGYRSWIEFDRFSLPTEVLSEGEFRELVEGYPLLAEALGGTYSENEEKVTRGRIEYALDFDGDDAADMTVYVYLFGRYKSVGTNYNAQTGEITPFSTPREVEKLKSGGYRKRYSLKELFSGCAWKVREETIYMRNHEAEVAITVQNPSKGYVEARAEIEKLLAIVRQGAAE